MRLARRCGGSERSKGKVVRRRTKAPEEVKKTEIVSAKRNDGGARAGSQTRFL